ncbi:hypothetical protein HY631_02345 [Candidatus Uhrbacteria bacterium]|nr:hypothetical protein [Candidatus Uhrbacteria bacterium]
MRTSALDWVLRLAVFGEFLGHGVFALQGKAAWIGWIEQILRVDTPTAITLLTLVGVVDILIAVLVLFWKRVPRALLLWAAIWGLWTALVRPIVGEPFWDFVERSANWGAPLALLLSRGWPKSAKEWIK